LINKKDNIYAKPFYVYGLRNTDFNMKFTDIELNKYYIIYWLLKHIHFFWCINNLYSFSFFNIHRWKQIDIETLLKTYCHFSLFSLIHDKHNCKLSFTQDKSGHTQKPGMLRLPSTCHPDILSWFSHSWNSHVLEHWFNMENSEEKIDGKSTLTSESWNSIFN